MHTSDIRLTLSADNITTINMTDPTNKLWVIGHLNICEIIPKSNNRYFRLHHSSAMANYRFSDLKKIKIKKLWN